MYSKGGLGVRELEYFNRVLLGKWAWGFLNNRKKLWVRVVASRWGEFGGLMSGFVGSVEVYDSSRVVG